MRLRIGKRRSRVGKLGLLGLMLLGVLGMWLASASYWELGSSHPFFLEKLPLDRPALFLGALYVHVPTSLLALPACLLLWAIGAQPQRAGLHRWVGRVTGGLVLLAVVPTGMYLALFARGGALGTLGFWLTGGIAFGAMLQSIRAARQGLLKQHRRFTAHVTAQLGVAVISRVALATAEGFGLYSDGIYVAALWVPVLGGVIAAEWSAGSLPRLMRRKREHEKAIVATRLDPAR